MTWPWFPLSGGPVPSSPCLVLKPRPLPALPAASPQASRLQLTCRAVTLAGLHCRHITPSCNITFARQGAGCGLGGPWRCPIIRTRCGRKTPSPPAFLASPFVTISSGCFSWFLHYPIWFPPDLCLCCSQMGSWDDHPFLTEGVSLPPLLAQGVSGDCMGSLDNHLSLGAMRCPSSSLLKWCQSRPGRQSGLLLLLS